MSNNFLKYIQPNVAFDPDTLALLGDVYDLVCNQHCAGRLDAACKDMANRIIAAAMKGERDRYKLSQIAVPRT